MKVLASLSQPIQRGLASQPKPNGRLWFRLNYKPEFIDGALAQKFEEMRDDQYVPQAISSTLLTATRAGLPVTLPDQARIRLPSLGWFAALDLEVPWSKMLKLWNTYRYDHCSEARALHRQIQYERRFANMWPDAAPSLALQHNVLSLYANLLRSHEVLEFEFNRQGHLMTVVHEDIDLKPVRQTCARRHFSVQAWGCGEQQTNCWIAASQLVTIHTYGFLDHATIQVPWRQLKRRIDNIAAYTERNLEIEEDLMISRLRGAAESQLADLLCDWLASRAKEQDAYFRIDIEGRPYVLKFK